MKLHDYRDPEAFWNHRMILVRTEICTQTLEIMDWLSGVLEKFSSPIDTRFMLLWEGKSNFRNSSANLKRVSIDIRKVLS